uniref:Uncharacterized protein n=1 Tax=Timema shepardi TaxID=629360 RepID=A0A7R9B5V0_TIMSH|nr:unnamed protein product [Timema shepardi]
MSDSREVGILSTERIPSRGSSQSGSLGPGTRSDPVFDNNLVTNVTAQLGGTAFLRCRVRNLGERPVRKTSLHEETCGPGVLGVVLTTAPLRKTSIHEENCGPGVLGVLLTTAPPRKTSIHEGTGGHEYWTWYSPQSLREKPLFTKEPVVMECWTWFSPPRHQGISSPIS